MASLVGAVASAFCGVVLVVVIARHFDKENTGTFFACTAIFAILLAVVELGTDAGLTRFVPQKLVLGLHGDVMAVVRAAAVPVLVSSFATATLLWILAGPLGGWVVGDAHSDRFATLIRTLAVFLPLAASYDTALAATRGLGTMRPTVLVENIGRVVVQVVAIVVVRIFGAGVAVVAMAWAVPYVIGLAVAVWWLWRLAAARGVPPAGLFSASRRSSMGVAREFWSFTAPRSFARISQIALKRADIVLVAALASPGEAAVYTAATRFLVAGQLGVRAIQQVLAPQLARLFSQQATDDAREVVHLSTTWSVMIAWPIYVGCAVLAPLVMSIFGHGYGTGEVVVVTLALSMLIGIATGPVDVILLMAGRSWLSLANNLLAVCLDLGLDIVLIPKYGILGAAISWSVAIVVSNLAAVWQVWRYLEMRPGDWQTARVALAALGCLGAAPGVSAVLQAGTSVTGTLLIAGAPVYVALLWYWRKPLVLDLLWGAMRPSN
jgi:O-antigen/teichoic acid export membrane protein